MNISGLSVVSDRKDVYIPPMSQRQIGNHSDSLERVERVVKRNFDLLLKTETGEVSLLRSQETLEHEIQRSGFGSNLKMLASMGVVKYQDLTVSSSDLLTVTARRRPREIPGHWSPKAIALYIYRRRFRNASILLNCSILSSVSLQEKGCDVKFAAFCKERFSTCSQAELKGIWKMVFDIKRSSQGDVRNINPLDTQVSEIGAEYAEGYYGLCRR